MHFGCLVFRGRGGEAAVGAAIQEESNISTIVEYTRISLCYPETYRLEKRVALVELPEVAHSTFQFDYMLVTHKKCISLYFSLSPRSLSFGLSKKYFYYYLIDVRFHAELLWVEGTLDVLQTVWNTSSVGLGCMHWFFIHTLNTGEV